MNKIKVKNFVDEYGYKLRPGYINAMLPWFSPGDLSNRFGLSRQYWCKLIKHGKLLAKHTAAGPIVTTEYLLSYFYEQDGNKK